MEKIENADLGRVSVEEFSVMEKLPLVMVLENVRSALNVGSFFRTADAFGIQELVLCGYTATPPSKEIRKTALGAEMSVQWSHYPTATIAIEKLRSEGYRILAVEQVRGAISLEEFCVCADHKYALVFGNEVEGVEQETVNLCDGGIEIPQVGTKHSLNVSVAGGVVMWKIFEQVRFLQRR